MLWEPFLSPFLIWSPSVAFGVAFILAAVSYFLRSGLPIAGRLRWFFDYRALISGVLGFRVLYASAATVGQYFAFASGGIGQYLLPPHQSLAYLLYYSWARFWLGSVVITLGVSLLFYFFLQSLKKYRERFFDEGEAELGLLMALIVGWPNFVLFLPAAFVFVVLASIVRRIFFGELYTTLGTPFLAAALLVLVWGEQLLAALHLTVLRI